jgi:hypothetical protein
LATLFIHLEIKDTTYTARGSSYIDIYIDIDSEVRLGTKHYDKRNDFNCLIMNFPLTCSNIQTVSAYGVHISQLLLYSIAYGVYHDFIDKGMLLTRKLIIMKQCFLEANLNPATWRFYGPHHNLVNRCRICVSQQTADMFRSSLSWLIIGLLGRVTWRVALLGWDYVLFISSIYMSSRFYFRCLVFASVFE